MRLAEHGWPVVVTDGGSRDAFVRRLQAIDGLRVAVSTSGGLAQQIARSLADGLALQTPFILYTEPDKRDFFSAHLADFFSRTDLASPLSIFLASRTPAAYRTFPQHQQATEAAINASCSAAFSCPGDYSYGPFIMPRDIAQHLSTLPAEIGWGWRHTAFGIAHRLGCGVSMVEGDYECPHDERTESAMDREHRDRQLAQNRQGLLLGLTMPLTER